VSRAVLQGGRQIVETDLIGGSPNPLWIRAPGAMKVTGDGGLVG
jgi:hypothetical protein